jgi:phage replication O-like protein O
MTNIVELSKSKGFTRMDNDLYEALIGADLSGRELRVALAIHRYTIGFNTETARIAASVIADKSGIHREDVSRIISELLRQRVIYRIGGSRSPIGICPISEWKIDQKNTRKKPTESAPQCGVPTTSNVAFLPHYKDSKDNTDPSGLVDAAASTDDPVEESEPQAAAKVDRIPYQRIADMYNEICGAHLPGCAKLTDKRKRNIRKCWNMDIGGEKPFRTSEFWRAYFSDCLRDAHWVGHNDRGWRADIDFVTRESSVLKVLESNS